MATKKNTDNNLKKIGTNRTKTGVGGSVSNGIGKTRLSNLATKGFASGAVSGGVGTMAKNPTRKTATNKSLTSGAVSGGVGVLAKNAAKKAVATNKASITPRSTTTAYKEAQAEKFKQKKY